MSLSNCCCCALGGGGGASRRPRVKAKRRRAAGAAVAPGAPVERWNNAFGFAQDGQAVKVKVKAEPVEVVQMLTADGRYEDAADLVLQYWSDRVRRLVDWLNS